jgi:restriction system protein
MKHTIKTAIVEAIQSENIPLSPKEIYERILEKKLYTFKAKSPVSLVSTELRSYTKGINVATSKEPKLFELVDGKYRILK